VAKAGGKFMGVVVRNVPGTEIILKDALSLAKDGVIWVCGRREPVEGREWGIWHIQGIATTEEQGIAMCRDETYFIGPLPANVALQHDQIEWVGLYYPLLEEAGKVKVKW
jgi:hypothetical protein